MPAFGRHFSPDQRDRRLQGPSRNPRNMPRRRYWQTTWKADQKLTPECVGYAWAQWLASAPHRQFLEPHGIYELAKLLDEWEGTDYDGTSVRGGAKALRLLGFIGAYAWADSALEVARHVATKGPVVLGTTWFEGMNHAADMTPSGAEEGGHAYLCNGVNFDARKFRIRNSWEDFQTGWMSFETLDALLALEGEACTGIELRPTPRSRP